MHKFNGCLPRRRSAKAGRGSRVACRKAVATALYAVQTRNVLRSCFVPMLLAAVVAAADDCGPAALNSQPSTLYHKRLLARVANRNVAKEATNHDSEAKSFGATLFTLFSGCQSVTRPDLILKAVSIERCRFSIERT